MALSILQGLFLLGALPLYYGSGIAPPSKSAVSVNSSTSCVLHIINSNSKLSFVKYLSVEDGTFKPTRYDFDIVSTRTVAPTTLDMNGDGLTDVLQLYVVSGVMYFVTYIAQKDGTFSPLTSSFPGYPTTSDQMHNMDINGDGKEDVVQVWNNGGYLNFITYFSQGDGTYKPFMTGTSSSYSFSKLFALDINNDGKGDFVKLTSGSNSATQLAPILPCQWRWYILFPYKQFLPHQCWCLL